MQINEDYTHFSATFGSGDRSNLEYVKASVGTRYVDPLSCQLVQSWNHWDQCHTIKLFQNRFRVSSAEAGDSSFVQHEILPLRSEN